MKTKMDDTQKPWPLPETLGLSRTKASAETASALFKELKRHLFTSVVQPLEDRDFNTL